jgi:hypothetical protein
MTPLTVPTNRAAFCLTPPTPHRPLPALFGFAAKELAELFGIRHTKGYFASRITPTESAF